MERHMCSDVMHQLNVECGRWLVIYIDIDEEVWQATLAETQVLL